VNFGEEFGALPQPTKSMVRVDARNVLATIEAGAARYSAAVRESWNRISNPAQEIFPPPNCNTQVG
jgi:hypothetical protein